MENDRRSGSWVHRCFFIFSLKIVRKLKFCKFGLVHAYFTLYFPSRPCKLRTVVQKFIIGDIQVDSKWSVGTAITCMEVVVMA